MSEIHQEVVGTGNHSPETSLSEFFGFAANKWRQTQTQTQTQTQFNLTPSNSDSESKKFYAFLILLRYILDKQSRVALLCTTGFARLCM